MLTSYKTEYFTQMPADAKLWIYQADRFMTEDEVVFAENILRDFTNSWESHGQKLKADFQVLHHLFIVLAVDEDIKDASGCSIDKSVHIIKTLGQQTGIDFFNRMKFAYLSDEKIQLARISDIKDLIEQGKLRKDSYLFDNLASSKLAFNENWLKEVRNSWLNRYF